MHIFSMAALSAAISGMFSGTLFAGELARKYQMTPEIFRSGRDHLCYCSCRAGDWTRKEKAAVVLFFHGAGERGTDNDRQLVHGAAELTSFCKRTGTKALLLFPQCPKGKQWVDTPWGDPSHKLPAESENMRLAMLLLAEKCKDPSVDPDRVYAVGISMGGFGVWDALSRHPEFFAAGFPVCGGADLAYAPVLAKIPLLVYHGDSDKTVLTSRSRDIVQAIRRCGGRKVTYVEVPKCGHGSWGTAFRKDGNWKWLFRQTRAAGTEEDKNFSHKKYEKGVLKK